MVHDQSVGLAIVPDNVHFNSDIPALPINTKAGIMSETVTVPGLPTLTQLKTELVPLAAYVGLVTQVLNEGHYPAYVRSTLLLVSGLITAVEHFGNVKAKHAKAAAAAPVA